MRIKSSRAKMEKTHRREIAKENKKEQLKKTEFREDSVKIEEEKTKKKKKKKKNKKRKR